MDCHTTTMDFARGWTEDSGDTLEQVDVPGLDAVSVVRKSALMVDLHYPVEQSAVFGMKTCLTGCGRVVG
jgi:hypothetical protein